MTQTANDQPIDLDSLDLDAFAGRHVAVLGLARSGLALSRFFADRGAIVTAYDVRTAMELQEGLDSLADRPIRLRLGPDIRPADVLRGQALVATSPSISSQYPTTEPRLRDALRAVEEAGVVPVVSEVDLFLRLSHAPVIGVTGTKGKTTTSSLTASVLRASGRTTLLGGNIGTPLVERLPELTPDHRVVLELSELQLPTLSRGTLVASYTHVTADHLDRHGTLEAYRAVKRRLAELVPADGALILNAEDEVVSGYEAASAAAVVPYRRGRPFPGEVGVVDGWIVGASVPCLPLVGGGTAITGTGGRILPINEIALPGEHNRSNVLAAVAGGLLFGVAPDAIRMAVAQFSGVEHRLEIVATVAGVRYVNDSMGTQPDAVIAGLRSFPPPIVLIAGGRAKDLPLDDLTAEVARRAVAAVLIGESGPDLDRALRAAGLAHTESAPDMRTAVAQADALVRARLTAGEGTLGTVLLSPAAASFDMFVDYAERGRAFRSAVAALPAAGMEESTP